MKSCHLIKVCAKISISCHTYVVYIIKYDPYQILSSVFLHIQAYAVWFVIMLDSSVSAVLSFQYVGVVKVVHKRQCDMDIAAPGKYTVIKLE